MSQIYKSLNPGSLPVTVATSYVTNSGVATPAAHVLNVLADDTTVNNTNGIATSGSGSTVTVLYTNRVQGTSTSVGAVTSDIITFVPTVIGTYAFEFRVAGYNTTSSLGTAYSVFTGFRYDGVNSNITGTPDTLDNEEGTMSACDITALASGSSIILRATGYAAQTINWSAVGLYTFVGV